MGTKIQISVLPRPKPSALHQQYLPAARNDEEPALRAQGRPLSRRARNLPPQLAAVPAQPRIPGPLAHRLQGLSDRRARLSGPRIPDPRHARLSGPAAALPHPVPLQEAPLRRGVDCRPVLGLRRVSVRDRARLCHGLDRRLLSADPLGRQAPAWSPASPRPAPSLGRAS